MPATKRHPHTQAENLTSYNLTSLTPAAPDAAQPAAPRHVSAILAEYRASVARLAQHELALPGHRRALAAEPGSPLTPWRLERIDQLRAAIAATQRLLEMLALEVRYASTF